MPHVTKAKPRTPDPAAQLAAAREEIRRLHARLEGAAVQVDDLASIVRTLGGAGAIRPGSVTGLVLRLQALAEGLRKL